MPNEVELPKNYTENQEVMNLELGPDLGEMNWEDANTRLEELNKTLSPDEKKWRLPTKEEFAGLEIELRKIWDDQNLPYEQKELLVGEYLNKIGIKEHRGNYWSSTPYENDTNQAWYCLAYNGSTHYAYKQYKYQTQPTR